MAEFRMPSLGADMKSGVLVEWLKHPGERVSRGDLIAVIETEKGAIEIESFQSGTLEKLLAQPGEIAQVGDALAIISGTEEPPAAETAPPPREIPPNTVAEKEPVGQGALPPHRIAPSARVRAEELGIDIETVRGSGPKGAVSVADVERAASAPPEKEIGKRLRISPAARKRADELGIDASTLQPTGPDGAIVLADVERAAAGKPPAAAPAEKEGDGIDLEAMRRAIAAAMSRAKREIPHYYVSTTIDAEPVLDRVSAVNDDRPPAERVLPIVPVMAAAASILKKMPRLNGHYVGEAHQPSETVNLGMAIALRGGGLVAPAIEAAETLSQDELMDRLRDLSSRVRAGRMRHSELTGGTFTITSLGEGGVEEMIPIISPPQVAILAIGSIVERPWCVDGAIVPRRVMRLTLAGDHRVSDGRDGARFLELLTKELEAGGAT